MKKEVLFARVNKKGKLVFELPKSAQNILPEYYKAYANGMTEEEALAKLFSVYGIKNVKKELSAIVDEEFLERAWEEYKNADQTGLPSENNKQEKKT